jgi:hypothetical protein
MLNLQFGALRLLEVAIPDDSEYECLIDLAIQVRVAASSVPTF